MMATSNTAMARLPNRFMAFSRRIGCIFSITRAIAAIPISWLFWHFGTDGLLPGDRTLAEGVGFEPTLGFPLSLISSQVPSTTQPPFQPFIINGLRAKSKVLLDILIPPSDTVRMENAKTAPNDVWQNTRHTNLIRYKPSGTLFARFKVKGKLVRRSLKTTAITVAMLRLTDLEREERQRAESQSAVASGKMTFGDALAVYRKRLDGDVSLKPRSKEYREERIAALLKSWPTLEKTCVSKVSKGDCLNWAADYQKTVSATNFNNTVGSLKLVLDVAMEAGARYDNPAKFIKRARIVITEPELPSQEDFHKVLGLVKHKGVADLIRFVAYSGMRISEAAKVTWHDVHFDKEQIAVRGDELTGTKNWEVRRAPMIPDMKILLERLRDENPDRKPTDRVMRAKEFIGSVKTACGKLGIPTFNHHAMRHLFITRCMELGINPRVIAEWVGHKDGGALILKRYSHVRPAHAAEMAKKVTFSMPEPSQVIMLPEVKVA
jgi:integrase